MSRYPASADRLPVDDKSAAVSKQRAPDLVVYIDDDPEALRRIVIPFPHVGDAAEKHGKAESEEAFVKPLCARSQSKPAFVVDAQIDVNCEMFVRSQIVDDAATSVAVDHVRIESARAVGIERANPRDRLATELI